MTTKEFNEKLIEVLNDCENTLQSNPNNLSNDLKNVLLNFTNGYMNIELIYIFLRQRFPNIREITLNTLIGKGGEYDTEIDRFISFKNMKLLCQDLFDTHELTARKVLMILASKHVVWCLDYLDGKITAKKHWFFLVNWYRQRKLKVKILEHFGDVMNYLLISYIAGEELN